jgi:outer membrane receptor protein involved in Fe transport
LDGPIEREVEIASRLLVTQGDKRMHFSIRSTILALSFLILAFASRSAMSQENTANLNGAVKDSSGAVIPNASIKLTNLNTSVAQVKKSNTDGLYSFVNVIPGHYRLEVQAQGFRTDVQPGFILEVNQTATANFAMQVGSTSETISVTDQAIALETSTAEMGTVVGTQEVRDLPLNGRNFTELLLLTPGASPANPLQNAGGAPGAIGTFAYPAINGQTNRSNMFLIDGVNNYGGITDTNTVQPTIDDVLEFKVQSHNDEAQFGQVLGGIVNLVTKSGSNSLHGGLWEFFRNDALDANNYFNPKTALKQNQFGGSVGGPVVLPRYNGRNRTFFYGSYEGFRRRASSSQLYVTPTPAQLNGDFSAIGTQLYNPYSAQFAPDGSYTNSPFMCDSSGNALPTNAQGIQAAGSPCNKIPVSLINPSMSYYAKTLFPAPINTGQPGFNGRDSTENIVTSNQMSARVDQQLGNNDRLFFRYTGAWQTDSGSGGVQGNLSNTQINNYNIAVNWAHNFKANAIMQFTFGRVNGQNNGTHKIANAPSDFLQKAGFASSFTDHSLGTAANPIIPTVDISAGYLIEGNFTGTDNYSNIYEYKNDDSKMIGRHLLRFGASLATDDRLGTTLGSVDVFGTIQTSNGSAGNGGDTFASMLIGLPTYAETDTVYSLVHGGKIFGAYFEDQWRVNDRLTLNLGLRYDVTDWPREGNSATKSNITGNMDLNNGTYVLQNPAPACSATQGAPCIPGGTLPAHVTVSPNGKIIQNTYDNIQPRVGVAYRINDKTVFRAGYGRFFDNWAAVVGFAANFTQSWPNNAFLAAGNLNTPTPTSPSPSSFATDPLNLGNGPVTPAPNPFGQGNGFLDPRIKDPYSDQYNFGFQRQMAGNSVVSVNYVGSHNHREQLQMTGNTALTPGPGDPQLRAPFPYIQPQNGYVRSVGMGNYNSLQVSSEGRSAHGLVHKLAYTYSKAINYGCDTYSAFCDVQDPYHFQKDKGVAGFDLTHIFAASVVYELPFGKGRRWSTESKAVDALIGGWQLNGILSLSSGTPYDVQAPTQIANTNNISGALRPNIVGDPHAGATKLHPINVNAFALPAPFTFGDMGRNSLRSDWHRDLDVSVFREFSFTESKRLEFRAEAFNVTNTPVFAMPDNNITDSNFGVVSSTANTERQLQLALKFYF